jgi:lipid-binding SYLF domain-containing protein
MGTCTRRLAILVFLSLAVAVLVPSGPAVAASAAEMDQAGVAALERLYASTPIARTLAGEAKGILIFPSVVKAGFIFGAEYGNGILRKAGRTVGYYNLAAASYGLQAGAQDFEYAMFFMTDSAMAYFDQSDGFQVGVGPSVVVMDQGMAQSFTTSTIRSDVYAFIFGQQGLMAGVGVQGSKITRINP